MKKKFIIFISIALFAIQSSAFSGSTGSESLKKSSKPSNSTNECYESLSRGIFSFNNALDKTIFKPLAKGYRALPVPIRHGAGNVVNNLSNLTTIPNNLLQGQFKEAGVNVMRLTINTTIGILGIFDPANKLGLRSKGKEDYGQTLGVANIGNGCYFVLPVLGPTTARDFAGTLTGVIGGDPWYNITVKNDTQYFADWDYWSSKGTGAVDFRAKNIESIDS